MLFNFKYRLVKLIETIPLLQIFIYNNLEKFNFLFPHDKDYNGIKLLFHKNEKRDFLDIGANIGLSTIGFREMGFKLNNIHLFEPDNFLIKEYLNLAGVDSKNYSGHSLRSGFATSAAESGAEERSIMAMTGHKSTEMVRRYIKEANLFKNNPLNKIKI